MGTVRCQSLLKALASPGGNIASSWAVLQCMGEDGYLEMARQLMEVTRTMIGGINAIEVKNVSFSRSCFDFL